MQGFPIGRWHLPTRLWAGFFAGQAVAANSRRSIANPRSLAICTNACRRSAGRAGRRDNNLNISRLRLPSSASEPASSMCRIHCSCQASGNHRQAAGRKLKSSLAPPAPGRRRARPWRPDSAAAGALLAGVAADRTLAAASGPLPLTPAHAIALRGCCKLCRKDRDRLSSHPVHGARQGS